MPAAECWAGGWPDGGRAASLTPPAAAQEGEYEDDGEVIDDAEVEAVRAENESRMHARMEQERAGGNQMTDEQLEAFVKERCAPSAAAPAPVPAANRPVTGCANRWAVTQAGTAQRRRTVKAATARPGPATSLLQASDPAGPDPILVKNKLKLQGF